MRSIKKVNHTPQRRRVLLVQSWWEDRVLKGVAQYAAEHHWVLDCRMRWTHQLPATGSAVFDGIIAYCGIVSPRQDLIEYVQEARVPVVETQSTGCITHSSKVIVSHEAIGRMAAKHFLSLNFRYLGFVTHQENVIEAGRQSGFSAEVQTAGQRFYPLHISTLAQSLQQLPKPLGLLAANDVNALSVILLCEDAGFRIPEEIAVVGVDNTDILCDLAAIPLTSVDCNFEQQGYEAARQLDLMMNGHSASEYPTIIQPKGITARRSSDTIALPHIHSARFLRFLRDNFRESLSLEQAALQLGVSLRQVQKHFREHLGRTIIQELTFLRVELAKKLLLNPKLKLEFIAAESGFANRFHFIRAFERVTNQTPKQFRAKE